MDFRKKIKKFFGSKLGNFLLVSAVPVLFLIISIVTIPHYGINWDEPFHFARGQATLRYLLTGKKDFLDIPAYSPAPKGSSDFMDQFGKEMDLYLNSPKSKENPSSTIKRSYYQSDVWTYEYMEIRDGFGHPGVNDLMAAFANFIFYQKLKIMGDIESYHFFEVIASFLVVLAIALLVYYRFGLGASFVAALSLASYPLFFSESHFNIKDPPLSAFFGLTIITFYFGIIKRNWKLIFLSALFFALAFGTKFSAFFIVFVIVPWLIFYLITEYRKKNFPKILKQKRWIITLLFFPIISAILFYGLSPTFWADPKGRLSAHLQYYRQIGVGTPPELSSYLINGWNTYPFIWFLITTPLPILMLTLIGIVVLLYLLVKKGDHFSLLVLLWFLVPFARVTIPNTNIYGGIRQIMEFIPAMAILAGVGAYTIFRSKFFSRGLTILVLASLFFVLWENYFLHPNENAYFNQFIGGLSGARQKNIPSWGNTYGNVYLQGVKWMNDNVEENAKLALPINTPYHLPRTKLRKDIDFSNAYLSLGEHQGEYIMEHYFDWYPKEWYRYAYYDIFLKPVHEVKVDGVPLLKIWKNSEEFVRGGYDKEMSYPILITKRETEPIATNVLQTSLTIDLGKEIYLTRIRIQHSKFNCDKQLSGYGYISLSNDGVNWLREPEELYLPQVAFKKGEFDDDAFTFLFPAKRARYILVDSQMENPCLLKNPQILVKGLVRLP